MVRITGGERTSENAGKAKSTVMAQLPHSPGPEGLPQEGHNTDRYYWTLMYADPLSSST
jgi:hypothetical protein